eukprot:360147-Chlamydomonas_euryale.AAC.14
MRCKSSSGMAETACLWPVYRKLVQLLVPTELLEVYDAKLTEVQELVLGEQAPSLPRLQYLLSDHQASAGQGPQRDAISRNGGCNQAHAAWILQVSFAVRTCAGLVARGTQASTGGAAVEDEGL